MNEPVKPKRRWLPRYSLRSLLVFVLLVNSACLLWIHWKPWTLETTLKGHTKRINGVAFSPNGKRVVTGSHDFTACVWNTFTGERLLVLKPEIGYVRYVGFSRDGKHILTSGRITNAWDAETGKVYERASQAYFKPLRWRAYTQDGTRFATAGSNGEVIVWEYPPILRKLFGAMPYYKWYAHDARVLSLDFSHDGKRLVIAGEDGIAKIWRYRHPERWWGIFYLLEFWATALLSIALAWSLLRDRRILRQTTPDHS